MIELKNEKQFLMIDLLNEYTSYKKIFYIRDIDFSTTGDDKIFARLKIIDTNHKLIYGYVFNLEIEDTKRYKDHYKHKLCLSEFEANPLNGRMTLKLKTLDVVPKGAVDISSFVKSISDLNGNVKSLTKHINEMKNSTISTINSLVHELREKCNMAKNLERSTLDYVENGRLGGKIKLYNSIADIIESQDIENKLELKLIALIYVLDITEVTTLSSNTLNKQYLKLLLNEEVLLDKTTNLKASINSNEEPSTFDILNLKAIINASVTILTNQSICENLDKGGYRNVKKKEEYNTVYNI